MQALEVDPCTLLSVICVSKLFKVIIGPWTLNIATRNFLSDSSQAEIVGAMVLDMVKPLELSDTLVSTYAKLMAPRRHFRQFLGPD